MPKPDKRKLVVEKLANLELRLANIDKNHEAATYHRNEIVEKCSEAAREDLRRGITRLAAGDIETAECIAEVAALRIDFSQRLLEAEAVEYLLGEGDFLDLSKAKATPRSVLTHRFAQIEQHLLKLYSTLTT
jgi:hypothetical protein